MADNPKLKILCFDVSPGANTKKAIQATLAVFGVVFVKTLVGMAAANNENINKAARQPGGMEQLVPFLFLFVVVLGGCLSLPLLCAYQAVNKKSDFCHQLWSCCFGCAAFFGILGILSAVMTADSNYKMYCPDDCEEQFNNGSSYCTTVAKGPWGGEPTPSKVPKEYCDSKGTTFHGSWYTLYVSQIFSVVVALLHIVGTYYICNSKTELVSSNNNGIQMSGVNPQHMSYAQQPQIVTAVVVTQPAPGPVVTIVKQ